MDCKNCGTYNKITLEELPAEYKPLSPWSYFGHSILFALPVVGFILLIVFSFKRGNINKRNFARSYFCAYIILAVALVIWFVIAMSLGISFSAFNIF